MKRQYPFDADNLKKSVSAISKIFDHKKSELLKEKSQQIEEKLLESKVLSEGFWYAKYDRTKGEYFLEKELRESYGHSKDVYTIPLTKFYTQIYFIPSSERYSASITITVNYHELEKMLKEYDMKVVPRHSLSENFKAVENQKNMLEKYKPKE